MRERFGDTCDECCSNYVCGKDHKGTTPCIHDSAPVHGSTLRKQPVLAEVTVSKEGEGDDDVATNAIEIAEFLRSKGIRVLESILAQRLYIVVERQG